MIWMNFGFQIPENAIKTYNTIFWTVWYWDIVLDNWILMLRWDIRCMYIDGAVGLDNLRHCHLDGYIKLILLI